MCRFPSQLLQRLARQHHAIQDLRDLIEKLFTLSTTKPVGGRVLFLLTQKNDTLRSMKNILLSIVLITILGLGFVNTAQATVGGPTFIYDFKYNPGDESVYYTEVSESGRGCPPELVKISLTTEAASIAYSCDDGEKLVNAETQYDQYQVRNAIEEITKDFKRLTPIDLKKNNITIDINFSKIHYYGEVAPENIGWRIFDGVVYQNGKKVDQFEITGCNMNQPFVFEGYEIPGFDKKIVLLSSTKSDCAEGGYIGEKLYVIGDLNNLDKTMATNYYKHASALVPSESTSIVFEADTVEIATTTQTTKEDNKEMPGNSIYLIIITGLVALIVGFLLGKNMQR